MIVMRFRNFIATDVAVAIIFQSGHGATGRQAEAARRGIERVARASVPYLTSEEGQTRWSCRNQERQGRRRLHQLGVSVRRQSGDTD